MDRRTSRLKRLSLTVRATAEPEEAHALRKLVEERFMQSVLDACDRAVHRRLGDDALVFVRRLDARWKIDRVELDDAAALTALGEELAELVVAQVEAAPPNERLRPSPSRGMVLFRGEGHLRASALVERAQGSERAWFHESLADEEDVWLGACDAGPLVLRETIEWLARMEAAPSVIGALDGAQRRRAVEVLPEREWPAGVKPPLVAPEAARAPSVASVAKNFSAREAPPRESEVASAQSSEAGEAREAREENFAHAENEADLPSRKAGEAREEVKLDARELDSADGGSIDGRAAQVDREAPEARAVEEGGARATATATADSEFEAARAGEEAIDPGAVETRFAGLFYFAGRVLELELAESLYYAGAREGHFLVHVARALAGPDAAGDPAPLLLGGCAITGSDPPFQALPRWALDELWGKLTRKLGERLATLDAPAPPRLETAIDELAAGFALPPSPANEKRDPLTAHFARRAAAALALWFCARLGEPPSVEAVRARVAVPGRARSDADALHVALPMRAIDLKLRLAGLDFDPGFLPWLDKKLLLEFVPDSHAGEVR